jgi:hypothetical protein
VTKDKESVWVWVCVWVCVCVCLPLFIKPPGFTHEDSTLVTLSNPNQDPKTPPPNSITGLSFHPLNTSQCRLNFNIWCLGGTLKLYPNHSHYVCQNSLPCVFLVMDLMYVI